MAGIVMKDLMDIMQAMINLELVLAKFYKSLALKWPEDGEFWEHIRKDEVTHAKNLKVLFDFIKKRPEEFSAGRSFNLTAIKSISAHIESTGEKVQAGEIKRDRIFAVAGDLERSLMESNYPEIVKSTNMEFQNAVSMIHNETVEHEKLIREKVKEMMKKK